MEKERFKYSPRSTNATTLNSSQLVYSSGHNCLVESYGRPGESVMLWFSFGKSGDGAQSVKKFLESREATLTTGHRALLSNVDEAWFLTAIGDQQRNARWLASNHVASGTEQKKKKQKVAKPTHSASHEGWECTATIALRSYLSKQGICPSGQVTVTLGALTYLVRACCINGQPFFSAHDVHNLCRVSPYPFGRKTKYTSTLPGALVPSSAKKKSLVASISDNYLSECVKELDPSRVGEALSVLYSCDTVELVMRQYGSSTEILSLSVWMMPLLSFGTTLRQPTRSSTRRH